MNSTKIKQVDILVCKNYLLIQQGSSCLTDKWVRFWHSGHYFVFMETKVQTNRSVRAILVRCWCVFLVESDDTQYFCSVWGLINFLCNPCAAGLLKTFALYTSKAWHCKSWAFLWESLSCNSGAQGVIFNPRVAPKPRYLYTKLRNLCQEGGGVCA